MEDAAKTRLVQQSAIRNSSNDRLKNTSTYLLSTWENNKKKVNEKTTIKKETIKKETNANVEEDVNVNLFFSFIFKPKLVRFSIKEVW